MAAPIIGTMAITIRISTLHELESAPNIDAVLAEYADECANPDLPPPQPDLDTYRLLEASGVLVVVAAWDGDELRGFINLIVAKIPHYNRVLANTESIFVSRPARKGGTGPALLKFAEEHAARLGALGVLVTAPFGSDLELVAPSLGYRRSNTVFFRKLT